jgi:hypothetical protein
MVIETSRFPKHARTYDLVIMVSMTYCKNANIDNRGRRVLRLATSQHSIRTKKMRAQKEMKSIVALIAI